MQLRLLLLGLLLLSSLSGCIYKYSWHDGWQYNRMWLSDWVEAATEEESPKNDPLRQQRLDFYQKTPSPYRDELKTTRYVHGIWITTLKEGDWVFVEEWKMDGDGTWNCVQPRHT